MFYWFSKIPRSIFVLKDVASGLTNISFMDKIIKSIIRIYNNIKLKILKYVIVDGTTVLKYGSCFPLNLLNILISFFF